MRHGMSDCRELLRFLSPTHPAHTHTHTHTHCISDAAVIELSQHHDTVSIIGDWDGNIYSMTYFLDPISTTVSTVE